MKIGALLRKVPPVWWFVLGFFLISCSYEFGRVLHLRPQPHHLWRQSDCLSLTWNYYDTTGNLFEPAIHNQFADDHTSGKSAGEFPLLYWIVGMLWRITGPSEFVYRLIVLLIYFAGTLALFDSVRRITGSAFWAWCTSLLFYASPTLVYFGISFLTDVPAFSLALIGWWFVVRYGYERRAVLWRWAVFFFCLAMLLKMTAGMSLVALIGVLALRTLFKKRTAQSWSLFSGDRREWVPLIIGLFAVYAWYAYAAWYNDVHGAKYTFNDLWPIWGMTPEAREWAWTVGCDIVVFQVFDTSVWLLLGVAFLALVTDVRRVPWQASVLILSLIIGTVLYVLCWFHALQDHDYYFINPMITLAVLLITFLWWLHREHPGLLASRWTRGTMVTLLAFNVAYTTQNMHMRYDTTGTMTPRSLWPIYHEAELRYWNGLGYWGMDDLIDITPRLRAFGVCAQDKVIFLDDGAINSSLVLMGNRGWTSFGSDLLAPGAIDTLVTRGARFLAFTRTEWLDDPRLAPYLKVPTGQVGTVRIFDLVHASPHAEHVAVIPRDAAAGPSLHQRLDTVACTGGRRWCFSSGEYPFEVTHLPAYGPDVRCARVEVSGRFHADCPSEGRVQMLLGENDATRQLGITSKELAEGPFRMNFMVPAQPEGVFNTLFIANRSGRSFSIDSLSVDVVRYLSPDTAQGKGTP